MKQSSLNASLQYPAGIQNRCQRLSSREMENLQFLYIGMSPTEHAPHTRVVTMSDQSGISRVSGGNLESAESHLFFYSIHRAPAPS